MNKIRLLREQSEKGSEILFENDELIVAKILTQEAACYYAQDSPWCKENYFSKYNRIGDVYYFIPKNPKSMLKTALFVGDNNDVSEAYRLSDGDKFPIRVLILQFPQAKDIIGELYPYNITKNLEDYLLEIIDKDTLMDLNPSIDHIYSGNRGRGDDELVIINSDTQDMMEKLMDLDMQDIIAFDFSQGDSEWLDWDGAFDEFVSGWAIYHAYDEQTVQKFNEIATYLMPDGFKFKDESDLEELVREIFDVSDDLYDVIHEYKDRYNESARGAVKKEVERDLNEYFGRLGITPNKTYDELSITVGQLLYWCRRYDYVGTLDDLILKIFEENKHKFDGWSDTANDMGVGEAFGRREYIPYFNSVLDKILSKLKK